MYWKYIYHTLTCILLFSLPGAAQVTPDYRIHLRGSTFVPENNIRPGTNQRQRIAAGTGDSLVFCILQFETILSDAEKAQLATEGIHILEYVPKLAYTAIVRSDVSGQTLAHMRGRAFVAVEPPMKMAAGLANGRIPVHAVKTPGSVDVWISFPKVFSAAQVKARLQSEGFTVLSDFFQKQQILAVRVPDDRLNVLAALPVVSYVQPIPKPDKALNHKSTANARANVLASSLPGGRNLHGEGVVVGIGDDANPLQHIDFAGRIINRNPADGGSHGIHVMGTLAGAGIMNERYTGFAPKATLVAQNFSQILTNTPAYVKDYGMVLTNNSYGGDENDCETFGTYDLFSRMLDEQAIQFPHLQHVFAAGNSGAISCSPYPPGFGNVISGYQTAKNVLTVGNTSETAVIASGSSRGPVRDGRLKPEIMAQGNGVTSTIPVNLYGNASGTSMAAPAVTGGLALLYQRYRQLHSGTDPENALMKALLCNGATDKGNEGPDYRYGFGWTNLDRAASMLEANRFVHDSLQNLQTKMHSIAVPAGTAQLKVMLYWNDPAPSMLSGLNLVHDLDLSVTDPFAATTLPRLLNPLPAMVNNVAGTGADHINNMEQVIINFPPSGNYSIAVKGTSIAQMPRQDYVVVYDIIPVGTKLTYPIGAERLKDGDSFYICWDAAGNGNGTFTIQYSLNNGQQWTNIAQNLAPGIRQYSWTTPANARTSQARVRILENGSGTVSMSEPFTILGVPSVTLSALQCEGYASIDWTPVTGATDYEVMLLQENEMKPVALTSATNYVFSGLSKDSTYYFSVRARLNGNPGRRALAIARRPDTGTCVGAISDHDIKMDAILTPSASGRLGTSTALSVNSFVKVRIKNLDDTDHSGALQVGYVLNGVAGPVQTISPLIEKGKTYDHTFTTGINLSAQGSYVLKVYVHQQNDMVAANDTIIRTFRQLGNNALTLPFLDDLETLAAQEVKSGQSGLTGSDRYDYNASSAAGRLRTFVNSEIAASGSKALTLDTDQFYNAGNTGYLQGTFNLANYNTASSDVRFSFHYKNHGQKSNAANKVWIRGKDTDAWIDAYDLFANQNLPADGYKSSPGIEVSDLLSKNNQNLSSSFQIRMGQWGKSIAADAGTGAGYTFDDFRIFTVTDDVQILAIVQPGADACGLGANESIAVQVRNSSASDLTNIPIRYRVGDGPVVSELIPAIGKRSTITFTFAKTVNFATPGAYSMAVWSALATDSFAENDSLRADFYNAPMIAAFPYIMDFEAGDGYWHSGGRNSSWAYGTPVSPKINAAQSGANAWKTSLEGQYNSREDSYLYSPCFQVASLADPILSFNLATEMEYCTPDPCDFLYLEYAGNGGAWTRLGAEGQGVNWYTKTLPDGGVWTVDGFLPWRGVSIALPKGLSSIRLRFVFHSDSYVNFEGVAIDDVRLYNAGALPVRLVRFAALQKVLENVPQTILEWETSQEAHFSHFEAERAAGDAAYQSGDFRVLGKIEGGLRGYVFKDENPPAGNAYYRLKMVDSDGTLAYSQVRAVHQDVPAAWSASPNPSNGIFVINGPVKAGATVELRAFDGAGRLRKSVLTTFNAAALQMDLSAPEFAQGLYMLEVSTGEEKQFFKVLKN